ncbi:MAG: PQQ-dependent sugar dehydrogenase [Patescibacteria group bacterium]
MNKKQFLFILACSVFILMVAYWIVFLKNKSQPAFVSIGNTITPLYKGVSKDTKVSVFADNVPYVTDIEITPDGKTLLAAGLTGKIYAFQKVNEQWQRQSELFFDLETFQPGFPPEEAGLTGIILAADFDQSQQVFLNYSYSPSKKTYKNRVSRVTVNKIGESLIGLDPKLIFEANTDGAPSHQIQDGVGLMVANKPHILFGIGEGFKANQALDVNKEAGKLILIQSDGSSPEGIRPYDNPKIQAIGVRNPPDIAVNPVNGNIVVSDTGPDHFDRLLYGKLVDSSGDNVKRFNFGWDGKETSLNKTIANPFGSGNLNLYKWKDTETAVSLSFFSENQLLVTLFGKTGSKDNTPGKKLILGTIVGNRITFKTIIDRQKEGDGQLANPIGSAVDPITKEIYFGDLMEGRIYKAALGGVTN